MLFLRLLCALLLSTLALDSLAELKLKVMGSNGSPVAGAIVSLDGMVSQSTDEVAVMNQVNRQFEPRVLLINQNQSVSFPNSDQIRHHVYSFSEPKRFEIKLYAGVPTEPLVFDKPGISVLGCNIHDQMIGYIYIADRLAGQSDSEGFVSFQTQDKSSLSTIEIWHPDMISMKAVKVKFGDLPQLPNGAYQVNVELTNKNEKAFSPKSSFGGRKL